jgi:hypothetical protein
MSELTEMLAAPLSFQSANRGAPDVDAAPRRALRQ